MPQADPASPFYRVALKAVILDNQNRMLVVKSHKGFYEIPGGGWEHGEAIAQALERELQEETQLDIEVDTSRPLCIWQAYSSEWGYQAMRIVYRAKLRDPAQQPVPSDGMTEIRFADKDELMQLYFPDTDEPIKQFADIIFTK